MRTRRKRALFLLAGTVMSAGSGTAMAAKPPSAGQQMAGQMVSAVTSQCCRRMQGAPQQARQQKRPAIDMQINDLRTEAGGEADAGKRAALTRQINPLARTRAAR